jgi:hypothetical protein
MQYDTDDKKLNNSTAQIIVCCFYQQKKDNRTIKLLPIQTLEKMLSSRQDCAKES